MGKSILALCKEGTCLWETLGRSARPIDRWTVMRIGCCFNLLSSHLPQRIVRRDSSKSWIPSSLIREVSRTFFFWVWKLVWQRNFCGISGRPGQQNGDEIISFTSGWCMNSKESLPYSLGLVRYKSKPKGSWRLSNQWTSRVSWDNPWRKWEEVF